MDGSTTFTRLKKAYEEYLATLNPEEEDDFDHEAFLSDLHDGIIGTGEDLNPENFPELGNISSGFMFQMLPVPAERKVPEFVYVPSILGGSSRDEKTKRSLAVSEWNVCWETAQLRNDMFGDRLPKDLRWIERHSEDNIYLLPRTQKHRYNSYAVLFHMLPSRVLERYSLPFLKKGIWPHIREDVWRESILPPDFDERLSRAVADVVWSSIDSGSGLRAFSGEESLKLLAHNLDFWLPYAYRVAESRLQQFPRVEPDNEEQAELIREANANRPPHAVMERPRMGGTLWQGEEEAGQALREMVSEADRSGKLRGIIEAIRSNRVEEDFSDQWSNAKEDFERKIFHKRSKISVKFVELDDTIPVHGPESEVHEDLIWEDFLGILNAKEKQITILIRNGHTRLGDIAKEIGYANHSPVSKALGRIRKKALEFLED